MSDFRLGLTAQRARRIAWFDLSNTIAPIRSVFADGDGRQVREAVTVTAGQPFDLDGLELQVTGSRYDAAQASQAVRIEVTNRGHLMPARWGWQYLVAELVPATGAPIRFYPDVVDEATGRSWSGDLAPGATMTARLQFPSQTPIVAGVVRITLIATGRSVTVALAR